MNFYANSELKDAITPLMKKLNKKFEKKINFLTAAWQDIAPSWAKEAIPYLIKNDTLIMKAKKNSLTLQYRQSELLKLVNLILDSVKKIKIIEA